MQGSWNHDRPHYRCTFLSEYAAKNKVNHPPAVYVREDQLLPELDSWLSELFSPGALPQTVRELEAAQPEEPRPDEAALREVAECDARLRQHRAALEAGADPVLVTSWMSETQARRAVAEARLRKPSGRRRMTRDEITSLVTALGDVIRVLRDADPADKAEVYSRLGLTLTYHPGGKRVIAEVRPNLGVYVGECPRGDLNPETGEISLNLDLNSKTGEKSPDRGAHTDMLAGTPWLESSEPPRLATAMLRAGAPRASRKVAEEPERGTRYPPLCSATRSLRRLTRAVPNRMF